MNIYKVYTLLTDEWPNINFEIEDESDERLVLTAETSAKNLFDDEILIRVVIYSSGTNHVFFVLDQLEPSLKAYQLINDFNENQSWAKAYIMESSSGKHYLKIHYAFLNSSDEQDASDSISYALDDLVSDETLQDLKPLTDLTR